MHPRPIITPIMPTTTDTYIDGLILRDGVPLMWQFDGGYISLDAEGNITDWNYYITDHLGSTRMVVTSNNAIKETISYYPYGSEMKMTNPAQLVNGSNKERFRFSGQELDGQNGLNMYDFGARMFDVAGVPVWTSMDPLAEKNYKTSPYSYCNGDPVNRFDPEGRKVRIFNECRGQVLGYINSIAQGHFDVDKNGYLYLKETNKEISEEIQTTFPYYIITYDNNGRKNSPL